MEESSFPVNIVNAFDTFFTVAYCLEMVLKILALGFVFNPTSYLRNNWNILDFIIVVTGLISQFDDTQNLNGLRSLRVIRPLRTVSKIKSLKNMVMALF